MSNPSTTVSFLISTFNRREALLETLVHLSSEPTRSQKQIIVIDNASIDGTAAAVAARFPEVLLLRQTMNAGACAKNAGLPYVNGKYIVLLDDDAYPLPGSIDRMVEHFEASGDMGAAIFRVHLPDGSEECSAYPSVFVGAGAGLRASAIAEVGLLPDDFFMQAEEYDLSLRLSNAGWQVKRFDDLHVRHEKTGAARYPARALRLDVRNNLALVGRYFPDQWRSAFARDWVYRYRLFAQASGHQRSFAAGLIQGMARFARGSDAQPVRDETFEEFAGIEHVEARLDQARRDMRLKRILLVDLGKNILPYWNAAKKLGLAVSGVAEPRLSSLGATYRGVPIVSDARAKSFPFDAAIVSNFSPVHARLRLGYWRNFTRRPVLDLCAAA